MLETLKSRPPRILWISCIVVLVCISTYYTYTKYYTQLLNYRYNVEDFVPFTSDSYYSFKYPKEWVVYQTKKVDNQMNSILMVPSSIADEQLSTAPEQFLSSRDYHEIMRRIQEQRKPYIKITATLSYGGVIPENQYDFWNTFIASEIESAGDSNGIIQEAKVVNWRKIPRLYTTTQFIDPLSKVPMIMASFSWLAKPDPLARNGGDSAIIISVEYRDIADNFQPEILYGVFDSVNEKVSESLLTEQDQASL